MKRKIWSAAELEQLSPSEQDTVFQESIVYDLAEVSPKFLEKIRARALEHIANTENSIQ
jgi:hypothetical protein